VFLVWEFPKRHIQLFSLWIQVCHKAQSVNMCGANRRNFLYFCSTIRVFAVILSISNVILCLEQLNMIRQESGKNTHLEGLLKIATNLARILGSLNVLGNGWVPGKWYQLLNFICGYIEISFLKTAPDSTQANIPWHSFRRRRAYTRIKKVENSSLISSLRIPEIIFSFSPYTFIGSRSVTGSL
jgi:hypothetical protein